MNEEKTCGCKGIRRCFLCDKDAVMEKFETSIESNIYWYCPKCCLIYQGDIHDKIKNEKDISWCSLHDGCKTLQESVRGIYVEVNFITNEEEEDLLKHIYEEEWKLSQSGRRKQVSCL